MLKPLFEAFFIIPEVRSFSEVLTFQKQRYRQVTCLKHMISCFFINFTYY
jgi:hypothetical protein